MLTNWNLEAISKNYGIKLEGIYMKDELDKLPIGDGNYIINMDNLKGRGGTHWVALCIKKNKAMYFDSFGCVAVQNVINFVKQSKNMRLGYNNAIIQDIQSEACGFYCIGFLLFVNHSKKDIYKSANDFIKLFKDGTKENDRVLKDYLLQFDTAKIKPLIKKLLS